MNAAKKTAKRRNKSTGKIIANKLVQQSGTDAIYIGPWLLFRRVAGRNDTKQVVIWIRESIAEAVDSELQIAKRKKPTGSHRRA